MPGTETAPLLRGFFRGQLLLLMQDAAPGSPGPGAFAFFGVRFASSRPAMKRKRERDDDSQSQFRTRAT